MGMSTHVVGFRPPDDAWQRMKQAHDSCKAAGVEPPHGVQEFFNYKEPDSAGVEVDIQQAVTTWNERDMSDGFEVDITKLPPGVKIVRFVNSY